MARELTAAYLRTILDYDPEGGGFVWRASRRGTAAGTAAGNVMPHGYRRIGIDGRDYLEHRLAWLYVHGEWPGEEIDHVNLNPSDNRIANLRLATRGQNARNMPRLSNNRSGFKGVSYFKRTGRFLARVSVDREVIYLGYFDDARLAHAVRNWAAEMLHEDFARAA